MEWVEALDEAKVEFEVGGTTPVFYSWRVEGHRLPMVYMQTEPECPHDRRESSKAACCTSFPEGEYNQVLEGESRR